MDYRVGIVLLITNLVVIGASYGAPSVAQPSVNSYGVPFGPSENSKDYGSTESAPAEKEAEPADLVVEPTSQVVKETAPVEAQSSPFSSYASAYNQGYEQGYAFGQGHSSAAPNVAKPIVNSAPAMYSTGQFSGFNGQLSPVFPSFDVRGQQQQQQYQHQHQPMHHQMLHQGPMQHKGPMQQQQGQIQQQGQPMMSALPMRPMNPTNPTVFSSINRRPIIASGPGMVWMTSPSAGIVPLSESDHDVVPANMIFGIGNRKPVRPLVSMNSNSNNNNPRPNRFSFGFPTGQSSAVPSVFNKFNGFGNVNTFAFGSNPRNPGFANNQFANQFNNQAFANNNDRNRRSVAWEHHQAAPLPTRFW